MTSLHGETASPGRFVWWFALVGLCAVLMVPLFVVDVPPIGDYPNHLARLFVLASLPRDEVLGRFYATDWPVIPNLALDLVAPSLMHVLPVHVVGRLSIAAAVLLPVLGTVAYNRALGGRWWGFGVGLIAYNSCLLYGFLNFGISVGIALLLAAVWLRWRDSRSVAAVAAAMIGAPILFACHLMGLVFFGFLIGGDELFRLYRDRDEGPGLLRRGAVLILVFAAPGVLYAMSTLQQLGGDAGFLPPGEKLLQLVTTFVNYSLALDMATALAVIGLAAISLVMGWGRVAGPAAITMILLSIAFLAAPFAWKGTFGLDTRFAIMLGFMLFAGFVPGRWTLGVRWLATAVLVALFAARMAVLTTAWAAHRTDLADLRVVLAPVQAGQAIYVAEAGLQEASAYWAANPGWRLLSNGARMDEHLGALVLIEHRAYWPFEFDNPSQQPIQTREPYRSLAARIGSLPNRTATVAADVCGFDYVLLTAADAVPDLPADRFRLVIRSGFAALYAPVRCAAPL
jgi:hypothetical protein